MKTLTRDMRDRIVRLNQDDDWVRLDDRIQSDSRRITVTLNGSCIAWNIGFIPLDWNDRRSIGRAARRRHKQLTDELIRLGQEKKREQVKR